MKKLEYKIKPKVKVLSEIINKHLDNPQENLEIKENNGFYYVDFDISEEDYNNLPKGLKKHLK